MSSPILFLPLLVAIVLIVYGRVSHRRRWGDRIAIAGYAVLTVTIAVALVTRG